MADKDTQQPATERLAHAYDRMLERVKGALSKAEQGAAARLQGKIDDAMESAVALEELSLEEAQRVALYLRRDLQDAGAFLAEGGQALKDWLRFDLALVEQRVWEMFSLVADHTRLDQLALEEELLEANVYHSGEVTSIGTLECVGCGEWMHFHRTRAIPPCPQCGGTRYTRIQEEPDD